MIFLKEKPQYSSLREVPGFSNFLKCGSNEFCSFLKEFLNLVNVAIETEQLDNIKKWLNLTLIDNVVSVPTHNDQICIFSQIIVEEKLIAYFPFSLKGMLVKPLFNTKSFFAKLSEAVSDLATLCFLNGFKGGDWLFGDIFAKMIVSNIISSKSYSPDKFYNLISLMEKLSNATFEGTYFPTGLIVTSNSNPYKLGLYEFEKKTTIKYLTKRQWFLADGNDSFYLVDTDLGSRGIYRKPIIVFNNFIKRYFDTYYLDGIISSSDFIVRTVGPNEISISNSDCKEFVKIENIWRYRHPKNITSLLIDALKIEYEFAYAILYYTLKCSRNHISSIIWIPNDIQKIDNSITDNKVRIWKNCINILREEDEVLFDKVLASDGACVLDKSGNVLYDSVFVDMSKSKTTIGKLAGSGETATKILASNGVSIKISQDGTIKIYIGDEVIYY